MAARYLLSCPCGESIPVGTSQAGEVVRCPRCGQAVDVPPLGKLRALPSAETSAASSGSREWTGRHAIAAVALIFTVIAGGIAVTLWTWQQSESGIQAEAEAETDVLIDRLTPANAWKYWQDFKAKVETYGYDAVRSYARLQRQVTSARYLRLQRIWMVVAGVGLLIAVAAWFWPSPHRGRPER